MKMDRDPRMSPNQQAVYNFFMIVAIIFGVLLTLSKFKII